MHTIMLVDDEKTIRDYLPKAINFEEYGFIVKDTAANGQDALEKLNNTIPDLILLDIKMPVMDGLNFLKALRKSDYADTLVVMLSGYSDFEYAKEAIRYGVREYLTKPVDEGDIIPVLLNMKQELDERKRKMNQQVIKKALYLLNNMYNGASVKRDSFKDYVLMTCVLLSYSGNSDKNTSHNIFKECADGFFGVDMGNYLFKERASHYTFLVSKSYLKQYNSIEVFAAEFLKNARKNDLQCSLMFDAYIFEHEEYSFREDYSNHIYSMLSQLFYKRGNFVEYSPDNISGFIDANLEQKYIEKLRNSFISLNKEDVSNTLNQLLENVAKNCPKIQFIQEITYRIYYIILDVFNSSDKQNEDVLARPEWLDAPLFITFNEWKNMIHSIVMDAFTFFERRKKMMNLGISKDVIQYVHLHYMEQINIKKVADKFFVNAAYLGRAFQKATGVNFNQYVNQLRIAEAKRLLLQTDMLIYEISNQVGYSENSYFVTRFTQEVGISPNEFRNRSIII